MHRLPLLLFFVVAPFAPGQVRNPVFAYELGERTPVEQARLLADAGFSGTVFDGATQIPQRLAALDAQHLQLYFLWLTVDVANGTIAYDPGMEGAIRDLGGRDTVIWLAIKGSGEQAEERAIKAVRHVADLAADAGLRLALYPHYGFYVQRFGDALRIADAAGRRNVGVTFNLCHELRIGWDPDVQSLLVRALPRIFGVTINGADRDGQDWSTLIQPLGGGDFDVAAFLRPLIEAGYRGPIGIQCFGIRGDPALYLRQDALAWSEIAAKIARSTTKRTITERP